MARYREIHADLARRIVAREWLEGDQLPTITQLQQEYDVPSLNTIRGAVDLLQRDGLVETFHGRGTFVRSNEANPVEVDPVSELRAARAAIDRALTALT